MVRANSRGMQVPVLQFAVFTDDSLNQCSCLSVQHKRIMLHPTSIAKLTQRVRRQPIRVRCVVPLINRALCSAMKPCAVGVPSQEIGDRFAVHNGNLAPMRTLSASSGSPATGDPMPPTEHAAQPTPHPSPDQLHQMRTLSASSGSPATGHPMPPTEQPAQPTPHPSADRQHQMRTLSASSGSPATGHPMPPTEHAAQPPPHPSPNRPRVPCRNTGP